MRVLLLYFANGFLSYNFINVMLKDAEVLLALDDYYEYFYKDFLFFVAREPHEHVRVVIEGVVCILNICNTVGTFLLLQCLIYIKQSLVLEK